MLCFFGDQLMAEVTNPEEEVVVRMACVIEKGVCSTNEEAIEKAGHSDEYFFATIKINREQEKLILIIRANSNAQVLS